MRARYCVPTVGFFFRLVISYCGVGRTAVYQDAGQTYAHRAVAQHSNLLSRTHWLSWYVLLSDVVYQQTIWEPAADQIERIQHVVVEIVVIVDQGSLHQTTMLLALLSNQPSSVF